MTLTDEEILRWEAGHRPIVAGTVGRLAPFLKDDMVLVDVGAHTGLFTAEVMGRVTVKKAYLFEPADRYFWRLRKRFSGIKEIESWKIALGSRMEADADLHLGYPNLGWNTLIEEKTNEENRVLPAERIAILAFDSFFYQDDIEHGYQDSIDLVKIDVEGYESEVLKGMMGYLWCARKKPTIFCEVGWGKSNPLWKEEIKVFEGLFAMGYKRFSLDIDRTTDVIFEWEG